MSMLVWLITGLGSIPLWIVTVEVAAALLYRRREVTTESASPDWPRSVILVPAHDEASVIGESLESLTQDLPPGSRIVCVAHNCKDDTAGIARAHGADVVEASDDGSKGKPAALLAGLAVLDANPPDIVVVVDADCRVSPGTLAALIRGVEASGHPVMGSYRFAPADPGDARASVSSLAVLLKNHVRPLGLHALGLPCLINGSGSAFPFEAVRNAPHGEGSIAEDFQLAIDLLQRGHPTRFIPEATILGRLPGRRETALKQRQRWEHGHLSLVLGAAPRLFVEGIARFDLPRIALALETGVPPLALLGAIYALVLALATANAVGSGDFGPLLVATASALAFGVAVFAAWVRFAGWRTTTSALAALPVYLFWKIPIYLRFATARESVWRKTGRD